MSSAAQAGPPQVGTGPNAPPPGKGLLTLGVKTYKRYHTHELEAFIGEVCQVLVLNGYSKEAKVIKQDIDKMSTREARKWIDTIWGEYLTGNDVLTVLQHMAEAARS